MAKPSPSMFRPTSFWPAEAAPATRNFIVQAIQWGNEHRLRTTMLLSPYPWPANSKGKPYTFRQFTNNTFSSDTPTFVRRLSQQQANSFRMVG